MKKEGNREGKSRVLLASVKKCITAHDTKLACQHSAPCRVNGPQEGIFSCSQSMNTIGDPERNISPCLVFPGYQTRALVTRFMDIHGCKESFRHS